MNDLLVLVYPWVKSIHVISVIAWMAGLFYLPRLFVHHTESVAKGSDTDALFKSMEMKLLRVIMNPAMITAWVFGLILVFTPGVIDWSAIWPWTKAISVIAMTWFHMWLSARRKDLAAGTSTVSGKRFRLMNEFPTVLLVIIVISVIARPF